MAGAGKRTFIAGEVLTAAQVNDYLMDQAVMRFSGSAARAASITAPTEGMVTYLDDVNRVEYYDGAAWTPISPTDVVRDSDFTAKGQILVASANAAPIPVSIGTEGQVLTAASAQTAGVQWVTPSGAGLSISKFISSTGVTSLPKTLTPGYYRLEVDSNATFTQAQFRFVTVDGAQLVGASINAGQGFCTIPTSVASINITTGAGFQLVITEIPEVSATVPNGPTVTGTDWISMTNASIGFTTGITPSQVGYYDRTTGSLHTTATVTSPFNSIPLSASTDAIGSHYRFIFVQRNADGVWSKAASVYNTAAFNNGYPFTVFTGNGTYTKPSWASTADVLVVSGGGGGGGSGAAEGNGGGGGAGGASLFTNVVLAPSYSVTVGGGGAGAAGALATQGVSSSFGALTTIGGGGGRGNNGAGGSGGSGGGGGFTFAAGGGGAGPGTAGQGNNGGAGFYSPQPVSGGGGGHSAVGGDGPGGAGTTFFGSVTVAGGGGGTRKTPSFNFDGGVGGGGRGTMNGAGIAGTPNTGGGGGGAGASPSGTQTGGTGGSGIVIVRAKV